MLASFSCVRAALQEMKFLTIRVDIRLRPLLAAGLLESYGLLLLVISASLRLTYRIFGTFLHVKEYCTPLKR